MQLEKSARHSIAATPHPEAAAAAEQLLRSGGNAIDAAVAAMMTLCVVMPGMVGLGGYGGSAIVYLGRQRLAVAVDFTAPAPLRLRPEQGLNADQFGEGPLSITVPTVLSGLDLLLREYGTRRWEEICSRPIQLAEHGVIMYPQLHDQMRRWRERTDARSLSALLGGGGIPDIGMRFVQKDLAELLRRIARDGTGGFYTGEVPRIICRQIGSAGGILAEEDFHQYQPRIALPLEVPYRGHRLLTPPLPSGGITTAAILKTLEQFDVAGMHPGGGEYLHLFAEVAKLCWREREEVLGDPNLVSVPVDRLVSEEAARKRACALRDPVPRAANESIDTSQHTANVIAADRDGNVISLTATQGLKFGSQVVIEGLGLVMNHGMSRFTFEPGSPNCPAPGKRMQHNMAPLLILRNSRPRFALGLPGGTRIVTVTAQLAANLIDFGMSPGEAVAAPRLHVEANGPLLVTANLPQETVDDLRARGHRVTIPDEVGGPANIVRIDGGHPLLAASGAGDSSIAAV